MDVSIFKRLGDGFLAVVLTFTIIGLLFLLKVQEDKTIHTSNTNSIPTGTTEIITYVD